MENPRPFNLNRAIYLWRQHISGSPAVRGRDMDELEDHLRDSIASLELRGLTAQEAFYVAQHRLGASDVLQAEFGKVNRPQVWLDRALWMVLGSLAFSALGSISYSMAELADLGLLHFLGGSGFRPASLFFRPLCLGLLLLLVWHWWNRSSAGLARLGSWMRWNPVAVTISIIVLLTVLQATNFGIASFKIRSLTLQQNASSMKWSFSAYFLFSLVTPVLLGWLLHRTRRQREIAPQD